jgi:4-amino-4-deoxychorismate lyase
MPAPPAAALVDGEPRDGVSLADRGLHYGDGLFETVAVVDGRPCLWARHVDRLAAGCRRLQLSMPDPGLLREEAEQLADGQSRAVLKIVVTRGDGGRGYRPPRPPAGRRILLRGPWPDHPPGWRERGVRVRWCQTRLGHQPALAGLKHLNRLEQVLARGEWDDPDVPEGLMRDAEGWVIEGTQSNLFVWQGDRLLTPLLDLCGVAGVVRGLGLDVAGRLGVRVAEARLTAEDVRAASALYLSSSLTGVWRVAELAGGRCAPHGPASVWEQQLRAEAFGP